MKRTNKLSLLALVLCMLFIAPINTKAAGKNFVTVSNVTATTADVSWSGIEEDIKYEYGVDELTDVSYSLVDLSGNIIAKPTDNHVSLNGLTDNTPYCYCVRINFSYSREWSDTLLTDHQDYFFDFITQAKPVVRPTAPYLHCSRDHVEHVVKYPNVYLCKEPVKRNVPCVPYYSTQPFEMQVRNCKTNKLLKTFNGRADLKEFGKTRSDMIIYPNERCVYAITARVRVGDIKSDWSEPIYIAPQPKTVKAKKLSKCKVKVAWSKVPGANSYTLYACNKAGNNSEYKEWKKVVTTKKTNFTMTKYKGKKLSKLSGKHLYFKVISNATINGQKATSVMAAKENASIKLRKK